MLSKGKFTTLCLVAVLVLTITFSLVGPVLASTSVDNQPTIGSDLADYNPGGTVTLTGTYWQGDTQVHIVVNDDIGQTWSRDVLVTVAGDGTLTDTFQLPNYFVASYKVVATGQQTSRTATATFTDANPSADLDQCANDSAPSPNTDGCDTNASQWVNGNLGSSKAFYFEGDSIPYRLKFDNLSLNSHTVTIEWDTTKSDKHALDYITTFNRTVTTANPCLGVSGCSTFSTFAIPADPQVTGAGVTPVSGSFRLYGGTITAVSAYTYAAGTGFTGDKSARITITFTASVVNPVLAWGGHIASRADWGFNNSAVAIPGSPYHTRLIDLDGSGGNQDRSLSADAVIFPGSITIIKDATPNGSTSFGFTASPSPLSNFSLVDDGTSANTKVFSNITTFQTYTVNESSIPPNWGFDSVSCSVTSPNGGSYTTSTTTVNITMTEGENWTCTYLDSIRAGALTVIKHVVNDNGGTATADQWSLHVKSGANEVSGSPQSGSETGTTYTTLPAGTYNVSETGGPSGYTFTGFSGDCDSSGNVTVVVGQTKTCTLTNNDQAAHLKLVKTVTNDNGGTAATTDFTLSAAGPTPLSGAGGAESDVNAGTYTLSETNLPGYTAGSWSCSGGTFTSPDKIALANGESATCTINNNDNSAHLKLVKTVTNDNGGTAATTDFTLSAAGPTPLSGAGGAESDVSAGTYTLSETNLPGYTAGSWSCSGGTFTAPDKIALSLGQSATCTINNDDQAAFVIVTKVVINNNGGSAQPDDFKLTLSGNAVSSGVAVPVTPGTYTAGETLLPGYSFIGFSGDCNSSGNVTVALGETKNCTLTNDDQQAFVTVIKVVNNNFGGTAKPNDFNLTLEGNAVSSGVAVPVNPGTYTAGETLLPGYSFDGFSGDCNSSGDVTVALGENKTCTLTNSDLAAHLIVIKHVINDNGGTAAASDFTMTINGVTATGGNSFAGAEAPGTNKVVTPGSYNVTETSLAGYTPSFSVDCTGSIALGQTKTCTVTNNDQAAHLKLVKTVTNDSGGTAATTDFTLSAAGPTPLSGAGGAESDVNAGTYTLSETNLPGYTAGSWSCSGGTFTAPDKIALALGESATCTINNDDNSAHLKLVKTVTNDNGGTAVTTDFTLSAAGPTPLSGAGGAESDVSAGTYTLSETNLPGYTAGSWSCSGGTFTAPDKIALSLGQSATCTINNNDIAPKLHLRKVVVNDNGGTATVANFTLTADGTGSNDLSGASPVDSGTGLKADTWALSETNVAGYAASGWSCVGGTQNGNNITVDIGGEATCTITNDDIAPKLHLRKVVINDNGGTATVANFTLTANGTGTNDLSGTSPVDSGSGLKADTWALSETALYGYTASAWSCIGGTQNGSNITVGIGGEATCTITNDDQPGTIIVQKIIKPVGSLTSFNFNTTGTGYANFSLAGGQSNTQTLNAGSYTVKELVPLGWVLTGIGGSTDPNAPYACTVTGSGGSSGLGDLNTQTATISLKNGDTVTCVFENTGQGTTRTQGFWATHPQLAQIAWFGGTAYGHTFPGVAAVSGIGDTTLCGRPIDTLGKLMGGFWSDISKTSTGQKRSSLDQARMQLLQQLLAAELNASAFGSVPSGGSGMFAQWESAYCGTNQSKINTAQQQSASFNTQGDSSTFTPGTSADSKNARLIANKAWWDVLP